MKPHIFYLTNDPERALGLETILSRYSIICIDNHPMVPILRARGVSIFSVGENSSNPNPSFRSSQKLLENDLVHSFIKESLSPDEYPAIMVFKPSPRIEALVAEHGYILLNPPAKMNRLFENKVSQYNLLKEVGVNFPKTVTGKLANFEYQELIAQLGQNLVLQFNRGHTGDSTYFIDNDEQFIKLKELFPSRLCRISEFIEGEAWTVNACATKIGTAVHGLSYQITGLKELTNLTGATVGNDWTKAKELTSEIKTEILSMSQKCGDEMYKHEFRGMFGLDFIVSPSGKLFLIEINARQPASTSMHAKLMLEQGLPPLQFLHINEMLQTLKQDSGPIYTRGIPLFSTFDAKLLSQINQNYFENLNASQVIIRNKSSVRSVSTIESKIGIYKSESFIRDEYCIDGIRGEDEVLFLRINEKQEVAPNAEIARVQAKASLIENRHLFEPFATLTSND